jgi:hypothetical protein
MPRLGKLFLPQLVPDVLLEFWRVAVRSAEPKVLGDRELVGLVGACSVDNLDGELLDQESAYLCE